MKKERINNGHYRNFLREIKDFSKSKAIPLLKTFAFSRVSGTIPHVLFSFLRRTFVIPTIVETIVPPERGESL